MVEQDQPSPGGAVAEEAAQGFGGRRRARSEGSFLQIRVGTDSTAVVIQRLIQSDARIEVGIGKIDDQVDDARR